MTTAKTAANFSKSGLERLHDGMAAYIERREIPGIVTVLARRGEVHVDALGTKALGSADAMRRDTIFRISSLSKPVTAVAAMVLVEDGKLELDGPVDTLLPELGARKVLKRIDGPLDDTVPAKRPITLRDLLTFRLGFGLVWAPPDTYPIQKAVTELKLGTLGPPYPSIPPDPDEWMRRFGTLPLMYQPGEHWMYNAGSQVLGVLIARAAKRPLETFLRERIFEPLGMKDTSFSVPTAFLDRLATSYEVNIASGALEIYDGVRDSQWSRTPAFPDGAGGLVSTADDYLAFATMMLNKGALGTTRILSERTVQAMTADQMTPEQKAASPFSPGFWENYGWGFGVSVLTRKDEEPGFPGRFGWDGGLGTSWYADPQAEMLGILLTQRAWTSPSPPQVQTDFWKLAYAAIA